MGHLYSEMYEAHGTRLDYQVYYGYGKTATPETSNQKLLDESKLRTHWKYLKEAYFQMYELLYTGIQGIVSDGITKLPIFNAKMTRNDDFDNAEVYTDSAGFYCRFTTKGNYTLTFSHPDYQSRSFSNFSITDYTKKYPLDVELWPIGTNTSNSLDYLKNSVTISPYRKGIKINSLKIGRNVAIGIYTINGKLVKMLPISTGAEVVWDGSDNSGRVIGNGCYIVTIAAGKQKVSQSFILSR
jgi:hypothetical protein